MAPIKGNIEANSIYPTKVVNFSLATEEPAPLNYNSPVTGAAQVR